MVRRRLRRPFTLAGVGLHSGRHSQLTVAPAPWQTGRVFVREGSRVPATLPFVQDTHRATTLGLDGVTVGTVEHLLAALLGAGITDAELHLVGDEVPALDGSALPWWSAVRAHGTESGPELMPAGPAEEVVVRAGESWARLTPARGWQVTVEVDFDTEIPGGTIHTGDITDLADARTFARRSELDALRAAGLARGGSYDNAVVFGPGGVVDNPGGLRRPDEPVAHKALDALGDWSLLGDAVEGHLHVFRGGHSLHVALLRAVGR